MEKESDYLMMSGIQHFAFCRRQWALIHIEQEWNENVLTAEGRIDHKKCHDPSAVEKRDNVLIMRGLRVFSNSLKLSGICDVVEFHKDVSGVPLNKYIGKWKPIPIEYKHGHSKINDADRLQLCAQAIAIEEMLVCDIEYGFLFYKETKRREKVEFDAELREKVKKVSSEMNNYFEKGWTPSAKVGKKCKSCSLYDLCVPQIIGLNVDEYIDNYIEE